MKDKIIEILKELQTKRTDGVHRVVINGIFPDQYEELASRIEGLGEERMLLLDYMAWFHDNYDWEKDEEIVDKYLTRLPKTK